MRIAVTGPESSGKTTLAKSLATHFSGEYIPEYARIFLNETKGAYAFDDIEIIAEKHAEQLLNRPSKLQIVDTDFFVLKIWSEVKFGKIAERIVQLVNTPLFDLHILCSPDMPWEYDPFREDPHSRDTLFTLYEDALNQHNVPFICASGPHDARLEKSIAAIHSLQK